MGGARRVNQPKSQKLVSYIANPVYLQSKYLQPFCCFLMVTWLLLFTEKAKLVVIWNYQVMYFERVKICTSLNSKVVSAIDATRRTFNLLLSPQHL